jgi:hypothetical protein
VADERDKARAKQFTSGVSSAQSDFNKSLSDAKKTLAMGKKEGNQFVVDSARNLINTLNTVVKPSLDILAKAENPLGGYTGTNVSAINQAMGGGAAGSGPAGAVLGTGGKGAYSLSQIKAYMDANNGAFPPDLNTIASGITASDLGNLQNQYNAGKGLGGAGGASGSAGVGGASLEAQGAARSAYALLLSEFTRYGLEALVTPLQDLIKQGLSGPEFQIALRNSDAYQKRFAANTDRIKKGLTALSPAEYLALEDGYQNLMRNYGLPASFYAKDSLGTQAGFNKLIANDVSAIELEDRIVTAQKRVIDAAPEVTTALKRFYPDINSSDILGYTLDPEKGLADIKRKITAAEIGGAALAAGLDTSLTDAEYLRRYGVTAETARQGFGIIGGGLERGRQLASIYQQPDYTQAVAEEEIFNLPGQTESQEKRKKIIGLEKATFGGQTGVTSGALSQNRAGSY